MSVGYNIPLQSFKLEYGNRSRSRTCIIKNRDDDILPIIYIDRQFIRTIDIDTNPRELFIIEFPQGSNIEANKIQKILVQRKLYDSFYPGFMPFNIIMINKILNDEANIGFTQIEINKDRKKDPTINTITSASFDHTNDNWVNYEETFNSITYNIYNTLNSPNLKTLTYSFVNMLLFKIPYNPNTNFTYESNEFVIGNKKITNLNLIQLLPLIRPIAPISITFTIQGNNNKNAIINEGEIFYINPTDQDNNINSTQYYQVPFRDISSTTIDGNLVTTKVQQNSSLDRLYNEFKEATVTTGIVFGGMEGGEQTRPLNMKYYIYGFDIGERLEDGSLRKDIFTNEKTPITLIDYNDPDDNTISNIIKDNNIILDISVNENITINGIRLDTPLLNYSNYTNIHTGAIFEIQTNPLFSQFLDQTTEGALETDISDIKIIPRKPGSATINFLTLAQNTDDPYFNTFNNLRPDSLLTTVVGINMNHTKCLINVYKNIVNGIDTGTYSISYSPNIKVTLNEVNDYYWNDLSHNLLSKPVEFSCVDETSTPNINTVIYYVRIVKDSSGVKHYQFSKNNKNTWLPTPTLNLEYNEEYIFDLSDPSNKNSDPISDNLQVEGDPILTFFIVADPIVGNDRSTIEVNKFKYTNETVNAYGYAQNATEPVAIYPRNIDPGEEGYQIKLLLPNDISNNTNIINDTIYYSNLPNNDRGNALISFNNNVRGQINFTPKILTPLGLFSFSNISLNNNNINGGNFSYNPLTSGLNEGICKISTTVINSSDYYRNNLYGGVTLPDITAHIVNVPKPSNIQTDVFNTDDITITWEVGDFGESRTKYSFQTDNESDYIADVLYTIQRKTTELTDDWITVGTSKVTSFTDTTAINYRNYLYRVYSTIMWEDITINSEMSDEKFVFICEYPERFPYGRWNNSETNKKLYQSLSNSCSLIKQRGVQRTGNLYPNSMLLSRKQIYSFLSRGIRRPNR